ncbi:hypothetical protein JL722_1550 [Aureococcus anophagefferens]|nr:hypothetical protein JL722_1550 [Aureococcus anophagefferens]
MAATLPYVVVYCSSESSEAPARCLEEPGGGCWVSDARHRFPVEVGLWVGDATLEALRFVAHESLAPRRVEVYVASGEGEAPRDDFSREPEALATLRRRWRGEYGDAVFTRVGAVDFHGDARRDARRPARGGRARLARLARQRRCRFVRLVVHEPLTALRPGGSWGATPLPLRRRRQHCVALAAILLRGADAEPPRGVASGGADLAKEALDDAERALVASGVAADVVAGLARGRASDRAARRSSDASVSRALFPAAPERHPPPQRTPRATPPPAADDDALLRSLETGLHRAKTSKRAAAAPSRRPWPGAALAAEARESAEEMRACAARDDFDGASAEQRRGRALKEERLRVLRRVLDDYGGDGAGRDPLSPRRPEDDDDGDLPAPPRGAVFCHAWSRDAAALPGGGARRRVARRRRPRGEPRRVGRGQETRRDATDAVFDVATSAKLRARRRAKRASKDGDEAFAPPDPVDSESDESDGGAAGSDSEPDANDMTLTDASMMTSTIDGLASVAGDSGARHFPAGGGSFDAALPVLSADGFWGFDERPLEPLEGVPLRLGGDDGDPSAAVERLLRGPETVSSRLVLWMDSENIADAGAVADALGQMHAVALSPPPPPPGGYEEWAVRRAARPRGAGDDGDGPFFAPPLAALLHARVDEDSGGGLRRVKIVGEAAKDSPRVVLVEDGATVGAARGEAALRAARCRAVDRALVAAVGDLALAFACQGNWIMRRQVFNLVRDGASRVDGAALGAAADDLALFEVDAERTRRYGAAPDDGGRGTGPPELAPFRRRRLLFAALVTLLQQGLADASADVFIAANRLLVDVFKGRAKRNVKFRSARDSQNLIEPNEIRFIDAGQDAAASPQRRDDDDDDAHLRPWEVLRLGVRSTGSPLREALVALRRLLPLVAQRLPRLRRRDLGEDAFASQAAKRASRRATKTLLKLANLHWLGAAVVAAAVLPPAPPCGAARDVAGLGDLETYADSAARPIASRRLAAARLRALALLVARSGALRDSRLAPQDVVALCVATLRRDPRMDVKRAAGALLGALYARLAPPTLLKPKHRLRAGDDDAETDARLAADPTRRRNDPSLAPWLLGPLARVDLEMERKYGSAPSVAAEAKQLKKAAQAAAAAREAAGRAAERCARDAHATAADALRRAYEAAEAARHRDARDRAYRVDAISHVVHGRKVARVAPRRRAAAAEEQRRKDEEVKDVELAMVASDALDAAPAPGDDGAHATGGATAKAPSRAPTPRETPRPDGKVHPLHADGGDAAAAPAAGDKDKKGCAVM